MLEKIENISKEFFSKLNLKIDKFELVKEKESTFFIKIESPDSGIIIGPHGQNLDHIKKILCLLISKILDYRTTLHLEVNDYLKTKDDRLFSSVKREIQKINKSGGEIVLPFLNSYERKKIHSYISDNYNGEISTKSIGEGKDRRLHLTKKAEKLSIDIDGDDI